MLQLVVPRCKPWPASESAEIALATASARARQVSSWSSTRPSVATKLADAGDSGGHPGGREEDSEDWLLGVLAGDFLFGDLTSRPGDICCGKSSGWNHAEN